MSLEGSLEGSEVLAQTLEIGAIGAHYFLHTDQLAGLLNSFLVGNDSFLVGGYFLVQFCLLLFDLQSISAFSACNSFSNAAVVSAFLLASQFPQHLLWR